MTTVYDMHCHLDFADNCEQVAADSIDQEIIALSSTVVPSSFVSDKEKLANFDNIFLSLGVHPWWVADGRISEADMARFEMLAGETRFIGEVGLDLHSKYKETKVHQLEVLDRVLQAVHNSGDGKLITLHAVNAAELILDELEHANTMKDNVCLFHWFSGDHTSFGRAVAMGCVFSVGMRMMSNPKTAAFAQAIPDEQLLIETDNPPHEGMAWSADTWRQEIDNTIKGLAELRETSDEHIQEITAKNACRLLG